MAGELGNNPAILNREFDSELRRISAYILQKKIGPLKSLSSIFLRLVKINVDALVFAFVLSLIHI